MKQTIDILKKDDATVVLMNAMCEILGAADITTKFNIDPQGDLSKVEVEVKVNGVPVPFIEVLGAALDLAMDNLNREVKDKAIELLQGDDTLRSLQFEIENAEWRIRALLDKLMEDKP